MKAIRISDAEWQIMMLVWRKAPLAAGEFIEELSPRTGWHPRTIRTLVDRLVKKGALKITPEGKRYLYEARLRQADCVRRESRSFVERVFGGEPAPMLLHLLKESKLTSAEIKELKQLLEEKEK